MVRPIRIPIHTFQQVSLPEKTKALSTYGTMVAKTKALDADLFLYSMENYFVEVAANANNGELLYVRASDSLSILDLYLDSIDVNELTLEQ